MDKQVLITTRVGSYVWYPALQLIDFMPDDARRKAVFTLQLRESENTELRALIKATRDMLSRLNTQLKDRNND